MPTKGAKLKRKREARKASAIAIPEREPNGRPKSKTKRERKEDAMHVALNQPHRRNAPSPTDQRCESALGRFCIRLKLRSELFQAGEKYETSYRQWKLAKGLRAEGAHSLGVGEAQEETAEEIRKRAELIDYHWRKYNSAQKYLYHEGGFNAHQAVHTLVFQKLDLDLTSERDGAAIDGLWALAVHYGLISGRGGVEQSTTAA